MAIVYAHRRNDSNEIFYIGIGSHTRRAYDKRSRNKHWYHIVNKHGYTVEITHKDICWEEACSIERYLIAFYGKVCNSGTLVNVTDGGDGVLGLKQSEYSKQKSREFHTGRVVSDSTRMILSKKLKGRVFSESTLEKMRIAKKGFRPPWLSDKNRDIKGEKHPRYGMSHSDATKKIIADKARSRQVDNPARGIRILDNLTGDIYKTIKEAAMVLGIEYSRLKRNLIKHSGGRLSYYDK